MIGREGILKRGVYPMRKKLGADQSLMWGEHFFTEAFCQVLAEM